MWITLTENDVLTRLAAPELAALKTAATAQGQDSPLPEIIAYVSREVRSYVAAFPGNKLGPDGTIPDELQLAALNRTRYELATRLPLSSLLTDARKESNTTAIAQLRDVAAGRFRVVQPPDANDADQPIPKLDGYHGSNPKISF